MLDFLFSAWPLLLALSVVLTQLSFMNLDQKYEVLKEKYLDLMRIMVAETKLNQR